MYHMPATCNDIGGVAVCWHVPEAAVCVLEAAMYHMPATCNDLGGVAVCWHVPEAAECA